MLEVVEREKEVGGVVGGLERGLKNGGMEELEGMMGRLGVYRCGVGRKES